jgi:hypothetical protein
MFVQSVEFIRLSACLAGRQACGHAQAHVDYADDAPKLRPWKTQRLLQRLPRAMNNAADNKALRAGRHVLQPTGYRAFIPAPLPPDPRLVLSGALQEALSAADYALGRLDGAVVTLPNPDLFVFMYVRKEAVLSSQIEGSQSSLQNLLAGEEQLFDPKTPRDVDVREATNYVRALPFASLQTTPGRVLRPPAGRAQRGGLGGLARILPARGG